MNATLDTFVARLRTASDAPLLFASEGRTIRPDYHVTEIRAARIRGLDCGTRRTEWNETTVELLDGPQTPPPQSAYMTAGTFVKIASQGKHTLPEAGSAPLYFEYGPGNGPLRKHEVRDLRLSDSGWVVDLIPVRAACKPALDVAAIGNLAAAERREPADEGNDSATTCCGTSRRDTPCCSD